MKVDPAADDGTIKAAFRRLALRYHPDRAGTPRAARRFRAMRTLAGARATAEATPEEGTSAAETIGPVSAAHRFAASPK